MTPAIKVVIPEKFITIYSDKTMEFRNVRKGKVMEAYVPERSDIDEVYQNVISSNTDESMLKRKLLPPECISVSPYKIFFHEAAKRKFLVKKGDKTKAYNIWMPPIIQVIQPNEVLTFLTGATTINNLSEKDRLWQYPVPNLYNDGRLCLGSASRFNGADPNLKKVSKLGLQQLFGVPFSAEVHNSYLYTDLKKFWDDLEKSNSTFKTSTIWRKFEKLESTFKLEDFL